MIIRKLLDRFSKGTNPTRDIGGGKITRDFDLEAAYFQISSAIIAHKDLPAILDLVVRESLNALKAHRATIFFREEKTGILRAQFIHVFHPRYREVGLSEERAVANNAIRQGRSFFLQEPKDFSEFFETREKGWKVSTLLSLPLASHHRWVGVLIVVLINEKRRFSAKDLKYFFFFANLASLAMENAHLTEELHKEISSRKIFEQYLDDMFYRVQGLLGKESWTKEEHLKNLLPVKIADQYRPLKNQTGGKITGVDGSLYSSSGLGANCTYHEPAAGGFQVEFENAPAMPPIS